MIVLISDGWSSDLSGGRATEIAQSLKRDNIVVYAIHVASGNVPDPIVDITGITGGEVFNPGDAEGLETVFRRIDEMQETRLEKVAAETTDNFKPFCLGGLALVGVSLVGLFGIRFTPW